MKREVYYGCLKLNGKEHGDSLVAATNYASSLNGLQRFEEAKSLLHESMPVARRVLGAAHEFTIKMRWAYAESLCNDPNATLDDVRECMETFEDLERTARRVFGGAHPFTMRIEYNMQKSRAALRAREALGTA